MLRRMLFLGIAVSWFFLEAAHAESSAVGTGTAQTRVVAGITLSTPGGESIDFGDRARGTGATVIAPAAAASQTFNVTGEPSKVFTITVPGSAVTLTNGAATLSVSSFTRTAATGTLSVGGTASFNVGATLQAISAVQAVGTYTGSYTVTVTYQ